MNGALQMPQLVVMSGVDLQYVGMATARDIQGMLVLLNTDDSRFAAAADAHGIERSAVLEGLGAQIGCASGGSSSRNSASHLHNRIQFRTTMRYCCKAFGTYQIIDKFFICP